MTPAGTPVTTLTFRAWKITLRVSKSTIPRAGLGVFITAERTVPNLPQSDFVLQQGELLDLGLYAPLTKGDYKPYQVFTIKNFIHQRKPEDYSFETNDENFHYDITDDWTGELHQTAKKSCLSYVNECVSAEAATVHAELDPEGKLHYMLGSHSGAFRLEGTANRGKELFIHYGPVYETVRVRKNYSSLPMDEQKMITDAANVDDANILRDILYVDRDKLPEIIRFLQKLANDEDGMERLSQEALHRALATSVVLLVRQLSDYRTGTEIEVTDLGNHGSIESMVRSFMDRCNHFKSFATKQLDKSIADKVLRPLTVSLGLTEDVYKTIIERF